mgnify:CR=1 FL=1
MKEVSLRRAERVDSEFLFALRNDAEVRRLSLNQAPLDSETHRGWFAKKLADHNSAIFIAEIEGAPIGQVRFDVREENPREAEVSIALVAEFRGKGYGNRILKSAAERFFALFPDAATLYAYINLGTEASLRSFQKAGYTLLGESTRGGQTRHEMALARPSVTQTL